MLTFPGFNDSKPAKRPAMAPPPPVTPLDPVIMAVREKQRRAQSDRSSTILTSPSGVLGDPPLDRPMARAATTLGGV